MCTQFNNVKWYSKIWQQEQFYPLILFPTTSNSLNCYFYTYLYYYYIFFKKYVYSAFYNETAASTLNFPSCSFRRHTLSLTQHLSSPELCFVISSYCLSCILFNVSHLFYFNPSHQL